MKKILLLVLLFISLNCFAGKTVSLTKVSNVGDRMLFQVDNGEQGESLRFYPIRVDFFCIATSDDGSQKEQVFDTQFYGTARTTPYTLKECDTFLTNNPNMNIIIRNRLRTLVQNAINEDISL